MAKFPTTPAGKRKKENLRQKFLEALVNAESFPNSRYDWSTLLDPDDPATPNDPHGSYGKMLPYKNFTPQELDKIEGEAVQRRLGRYHSKVIRLLDRLYEQGMEGDVAASKEFLNRLLGQSKQKITMEHEAGDKLTDLLHSIKATDVYRRPRLDNNGNEVIEIEAEDAQGISYDGE